MNKKGVALAIIFMFLGISVLANVSGKQVTLTLDNETLSRPITRIDTPSLSKTMELRPHLFFYIVFGDFYVDDNIVKGEASILFSVDMIYFIFPQPYIQFNTEFEASIITDFMSIIK